MQELLNVKLNSGLFYCYALAPWFRQTNGGQASQRINLTRESSVFSWFPMFDCNSATNNKTNKKDDKYIWERY